MTSVKPSSWKKFEFAVLAFIYVGLIINAIIFKDGFLAVIQAFCGITYTFLAGKGNPKCYLFGVSGSAIYSWLSFSNLLWGNLVLYMFYYIPMQVLGFFKWNKNLKREGTDIVKTSLKQKEFIILLIITTIVSLISAYVLKITGDSMPIFDSITTVFSVAGMYLTVRRCVEQWFIWILVNGLSSVMWIKLALGGSGCYSTAFMWCVYFALAFYFCFEWKKEIKLQEAI